MGRCDGPIGRISDTVMLYPKIWFLVLCRAGLWLPPGGDIKRAGPVGVWPTPIGRRSHGRRWTSMPVPSNISLWLTASGDRSVQWSVPPWPVRFCAMFSLFCINLYHELFWSLSYLYYLSCEWCCYIFIECFSQVNNKCLAFYNSFVITLLMFKVVTPRQLIYKIPWSLHFTLSASMHKDRSN